MAISEHTSGEAATSDSERPTPLSVHGKMAEPQFRPVMEARCQQWRIADDRADLYGRSWPALSPRDEAGHRADLLSMRPPCLSASRGPRSLGSSSRVDACVPGCRPIRPWNVMGRRSALRDVAAALGARG